MSTSTLQEKKTFLGEVKANAAEFKRTVERDMLLRRYQKWAAGEVTVEDRVIGALTKVKTYGLTSWRRMIKAALDYALAVTGIILTAPAMLLIAVAIKLDSCGPVFLRQTRVGLRGRNFTMYKFRSMRRDAEALSGPIWATENDPRVTRVGHFLRKTHLDELPQLFNVLKGEMSLVGPRPERPYFVSEFRKLIPHYDRRLCAKPGVTGLAQIKRRYDESIADVKKKLRYDALYVEKMCPLLDAKVIALTIGACVLRTGR